MWGCPLCCLDCAVDSLLFWRVARGEVQVQEKFAATISRIRSNTMATATQAQEIRPRSDEWLEVKAPEQFQFTKQGEMAEGILLSIEPVEVKGKQAIEYMFARKNGDRF